MASATPDVARDGGLSYSRTTTSGTISTSTAAPLAAKTVRHPVIGMNAAMTGTSPSWPTAPPAMTMPIASATLCLIQRVMATAAVTLEAPPTAAARARL